MNPKLWPPNWDPARRKQITDLLLSPDPTGRRSLAWRLIGPGSVPLGLLLLGMAAENRTPGGWWAFGVGIGVVLAAYHPKLAFGLMAVITTAIAVIAADWAWMADTGGSFWGWIRSGYPIGLVVTTVALARSTGRVVRVIALATAVLLLSVGAAILRRQLYPLTVALLDTWLVGAVLVVIAFLLISRSVQLERKVQGELVEVSQEAADERGQRRLLEDRARIAREMHDVVAHHMSVIAVQASTAEYRLEDVSEQVRTEFRSIADSARESLSEMRGILAIFREQGTTGERAPQPGIEDIETLVASARRTGAEVTFSLSPDLPDLPDAVSLTAYRIVQEALSNVVRHAEGADATVELYREDGRLIVLVMNQPSPVQRHTVADDRTDEERRDRDFAPPETKGSGLSGMRERVGLLKGELIAERLGKAGFVVKARLPLELTDESETPGREHVRPS